jgi:geranylgeranyl pyrophosphate synthase
MLDVINSINGINKNLYEAIEYVIKSGGKRLRAVILIKICEALEVDQDEALLCATALEMIHNYSLVHDDLPGMDNDDYRRGIPSCHKKFGEGIAILAGNGLYTLAIQLLVDGLRKDVLADVMKVIVSSSGVTGLLSGQAKDILKTNHLVSSDQDIIELIDLYYLKTGKLFEIAFTIPAILANCTVEVRNILAESGGILGVLYQLSDDLADGEIDSDIAETLQYSLLSNFYTSIDSLQSDHLSNIKNFARELLDL